MIQEKKYTEQDLIDACKYGYDYHKETSFPQMSFEDNCVNNFKQVLQGKADKELLEKLKNSQETRKVDLKKKFVVPKMTQSEKAKLLSRFISQVCFRNSVLEQLHCGIFPSSLKGDYTDVKVVSPYGEIEWNKLSRISDKEMRVLMLDVENNVKQFLIDNFHSMMQSFYSDRCWAKFLAVRYINGVSWDRNDYENESVQISGK